MEKNSIENITRQYLDDCGLNDFTFIQWDKGDLYYDFVRFLFVILLFILIQMCICMSYIDSSEIEFVLGHLSPDREVEPLVFPPLAAGGLCTPTALGIFISCNCFVISVKL